MKKLWLVAGIVALFAIRGVYAREVVYVDVQEVFKQFYKTKLAEDQMRQQSHDIMVEMDAMQSEVKAIKDEVEALRKDSRDTTLSEEIRDSKRSELEEKLVVLQDKEQEVLDFEKLRNDQIQQQQRRMTRKLLDEVQEAIVTFSREKGYESVTDRSAIDRKGQPFVLYVHPQVDITSEVLDILNSGSDQYILKDTGDDKEEQAK